MILETKRLIIRKIENKDISDLIKGLNNLEVAKYLSNVPHPYTENDAIWWINHSKEKNSEDYNIELKAEKKIIGGIGLHKLNIQNKTAEIGYWLNQNYWRQGIVSEAMKEILKYGFETLALRRIELHAIVENDASNAVAKKFSFELEGVKKQGLISKSTNKIYDVNFYALLKENWIK